MLFFISSLQFSIHSQSANINNFDQPRFTTRNAILPRSNPFLLIQQFGRDRFETRNNTVDRMATTSKSSLSIVLYQGRWLRSSGHGSSIHSRKYCQPEVMRPGDKRKWREKARVCVRSLRSRRTGEHLVKEGGDWGRRSVVVVDERRCLVPGNRTIRGEGGGERTEWMKKKGKKSCRRRPANNYLDHLSSRLLCTSSSISLPPFS